MRQLRAGRHAFSSLRRASIVWEEAGCMLQKHREVEPCSASEVSFETIQSRSFAASAERDNVQGVGIGACESCQSQNRSPDGLFCEACGNLQPVNFQQSYFSLMHQPENSFKVNHSMLDLRFKNLQMRLHPDKFSMSSQDQQENSASQSARVNDAFSTLKNPLKRAEYLLRLKGVEIGEETHADMDFLMNIMQAREAIENEENEQELAKFASTFRKQEDDCIQQLESAFAREDLESAKELLGVLRYLTNIQAAIQERL